MIGIKGNKTSKIELMESNGKYILDNICTRATVTEELNGDYSFDGTFIIDKSLPTELYDLMENDSLIYVDEEYGREYFRIAQVRKNKRSIDIFARHITISDILTLWLEDVRPTDLGGNNAINWIFNNAKGDNWLDVNSNIDNVNTAYYINKNVYEALFTVDNAFINRWGGEAYRRGFNLSINSSVGHDRGVEIRSRKNLKGLEISTNINSLSTRIYPIGFDGITIEEKHIDSELIGNYSKVYSRKFKYENVKVKTEDDEEGYDTLEQAQAELKRLAKLEFTNNKVDIITASYRVDFVELGKTEEYKNYSILEKTWLGDTIKVVDEEMNIDIKVRVTKRIYDCLRQERTSTELSNKDTKEKPPTIQDVINKLDEIPIVDENKLLQTAKDNATALINAGLKDSYVIVRPNEILIMDTKDINTAIKVWRWNNAGLGYSSTGYYGEYGTAITNDGAIVANFITTGILNADLIKTGMLQSVNGKTWINMLTGAFKFGDRLEYNGNSLISRTSTGQKAIEILDTNIEFFDWEKDGRELGVIYSSKLVDYPDSRGFSLAHSEGSYMKLNYQGGDGLYYPYITLDKSGINPFYNAPVVVHEGTIFNSVVNLRNRVYIPNMIVFDQNLRSTSPTIFKSANADRLVVGLSVSAKGDGLVVQSNTGTTLAQIRAGEQYPILLNANTYIGGDLAAEGSKNSIQSTASYGKRLINAYETAEYYFGDIGSGLIEHGECIIWIDDVLQECINTDCEYHIFTQVYNGNITKIERFKDYFIVYGEDNTSFSWELKAKRVGYENVRLDNPRLDEFIDDSVVFTDEELKNNTTESILMEELEFELENILFEGSI